MADAWDDLRELGVPIQAAEAWRDLAREMIANRESGVSAGIAHMSRGRFTEGGAARGRKVKALVVDDVA